MKLTTLLLIVTMLQVSAGSYAQRITLSQKNAVLVEVFDQIRIQTGYDFIFNNSILKGAKKVTISVKNTELEEVLKQIFSEQPLKYKINDNKSVVVTKKDMSVLDKVIDFFSTIDVTGKVVDEQGLPLPGASVKVKGGTLGTVTDKDGEFFLKGVPEDAIIVIAYLGYKPLEVKASNSIGVIKLELATADLNEVIINKGYYTTTKALNTGSVGKVTAEEISKQPVSNPLQAMQGRTPGIYIAQESGIPGSNFEVRIRGTNSIQNGNNPLYLVDGIPFTSETMSDIKTAGAIYSQGGGSPLNSLNPNDIESIEILKDADATAIYGSRGANGVVLITTKKGSAGEVKVAINASAGISKSMGRVKTLNTKQYLEMRFEALANDGQTIPLPEEYDINGTWDQNRYTDWQDVLFGRSAHANIINASVSGGSEQTQFLFNAGIDRQGTVFPGDNSARRISTLFSITHTSRNSRFKAAFSNSYSQNSNIFPAGSIADVGTPPNAPALYNEEGELNWENSTWDNPLAPLLGKFTAITSNIVMNGELSFEILKNLYIRGKFGLNNLLNDEILTRPSSMYRPSYNFSPANSQLTVGNSSLKSWIAEPQLDWQKNVGLSYFSILVGATFQDQLKQTERNLYEGFASNILISDPTAASSRRMENYNTAKYRYAAIYSRISYNWDNRYIANLTGRRDASSRFGPNRQFANLGALGVAWVFSEETIVKDNVPVISFGKLRASYGITGNDQIGDYRFLDAYKSNGGSYQNTSGLNPFQLFNPSYGWEKNIKLEAALEFGFFNNRISMSAGYYRNRSSNQLINYELASTTGFSSVLQNSPATVQNTGFEAEISTITASSATFKWTSSLNLSIPRNKLISFPNLESSSYKNTYTVGKSLTIIKLFQYLGVDPATGIFQFKDLNNDGKINFNDRISPVVSGQRFYGGVNNSISFKGIVLDFLFQFVGQQRLVYVNYASPGTIGINQPISVLNGRWQNPGDVATSQSFSRTNRAIISAYEMYGQSDALLGDASFVRLKNLSISYDFTNKIGKALGGRVYAQGQNLVTISGYDGLDPEANAISPLTTVVFGIQLIL